MFRRTPKPSSKILKIHHRVFYKTLYESKPVTLSTGEVEAERSFEAPIDQELRRFKAGI